MLPHQLCEYLNGSRDIYAETLATVLEALDLEIKPKPKRRRR